MNVLLILIAAGIGTAAVALSQTDNRPRRPGRRPAPGQKPAKKPGKKLPKQPSDEEKPLSYSGNIAITHVVEVNRRCVYPVLKLQCSWVAQHKGSQQVFVAKVADRVFGDNEFTYEITLRLFSKVSDQWVGCGELRFRGFVEYDEPLVSSSKFFSPSAPSRCIELDMTRDPIPRFYRESGKTYLNIVTFTGSEDNSRSYRLDGFYSVKEEE